MQISGIQAQTLAFHALLVFKIIVMITLFLVLIFMQIFNQIDKGHNTNKPGHKLVLQMFC